MLARRPHRFHLLLFLLGVSVAACLFSAASTLAQCYGGPCGNSAHQPGQVTWYDDLLSNSGWGEGPPCSSCHTTTKMVQRGAASAQRGAEVEITKNFPLTMGPRRYQQFHQQAVRVTRGRGPIETLPEAQIEPRQREAYRWVREALAKEGERPRLR